jgi:two-component system cell cycle response regulator
VIEDNPTNLELMTYLLNAFGFTVLAAMDGEQGLEAARREAPDLIICDLALPKLDGFGVIRRLKSHPALKAIPALAVTAYAMVGDREKALTSGFDGYISKPIDPETFVGQVEGVLGAERRPKPSTMAPPVTLPRRRYTARILVVDDSPVNLALMRSILVPSGYVVIEARTVVAALESARREKPDLILSDVHMPGGGGYELIRVIKEDPEISEIPFAFLSSTVWPSGDSTKGMELGAVDFILRPIEPDTLLARIEKCLSCAEDH